MRWNPASCPLENNHGEPDNLIKWLRKLPKTIALERNVQFRHDGRVYPLRLCAIRKSRLATEEARKKARQAAAKGGHEIQSETLEYAEFVMVLCSADWRSVSMEAALNLYRGRWQV